MALEIVFFVLWIPVAVVAAFVVFRWVRRATRVVPVALLAAAVALAGLVVFPRTIKDTAAAAHRYEKLWSANKHRAGGPWDCLTANLHACLRERVWGDLRQLIPKHDRYYLQTNYGLIQLRSIFNAYTIRSSQLT